MQYLLPRFTNLRRTFVQNLPQGTTFWVGKTMARLMVVVLAQNK